MDYYIKYNNKYLTADYNMEWCYFKDSKTSATIFTGITASDGSVKFKVSDQLWLSYRSSTGAVKLYKDPLAWIVKAQTSPNTFTMYSTEAKQYMGMAGVTNGNPYVTSKMDPKASTSHFVHEQTTIKQKPFYLIAHKCNETHHIRKVLNKTFNGIEVDVRYDEVKGVMVRHDKSGGIPWKEWLKVADSMPDELIKRWALLMFDIKEKDSRIPQELSDSLRRSNKLRDLSVIYSCPSIPYADSIITTDFLKQLRPNETIDVSEDTKAADWCNWLLKKNVKGWYADGIDALLPTPSRVEGNLWDAMLIKDRSEPIRRVYSWTWEKNTSVYNKILFGCDALVVNTGSGISGSGDDAYYSWADEYQKILNDPAISLRTRLATAQDPILS